MLYLALLRGINVGGNNKVEMSRLKKLFEDHGYKNVKTYINSGNIMFESPELLSSLQSKIKSIIEREFGFNIPIVLRSQKYIDALCRAIPKTWTNDDLQKTDVMFLWHEIDNKEIIKSLAHNPNLENVMYIQGALVWNIARSNATKSGAIKLIKTEFYKQMTVRNINTVRKLNSLMK